MADARPPYEFVQKQLNNSIGLFHGPSRMAALTIISITLIAIFLKGVVALVAILIVAAIGGPSFAYEVKNGTTQEKESGTKEIQLSDEPGTSPEGEGSQGPARGG